MSGRLEIALVVPRIAAGARLDRYLAEELAARLEHAPSRSELQRWIDEGRVTVGGASCKAADKLKAGAEIRVTPAEPAKSDATPDAAVEFEIVYCDDDVVVVNKPANLVVHPAKGHASGTLVNGLLARGLFELSSFDSSDDPDDDESRGGEGEHSRPGIVHRLDKGTSGVMVVARNAFAREALKKQFADHSIEREYEAICVGRVQSQTYATLHRRHPVDRKRFTSRALDGKRAVTHVQAIESLRDGAATLVRCRLETGRTHQIRVHLSESGHPILGDTIYGKPPKEPLLRRCAEALGHQALHARLLGFVHPRTGKGVRFEVESPSDFATALEALRG